jgi:tripartite-type tricarboxylate transporter receptor subunit TctC
MRALFGLLFVLMSSLAATAQPFPSRTITLVVPYPPGGAVDSVGRVLSDGLKAQLGANVIVENKSGGNGIIGMRQVQRAEPDGYTLLVTTEVGQAILPALDPAFPMDPLRDFVPLSRSGEFQFFLLTQSKLPAKTVAEFVDYAKSRPDQLNFGTNGPGTPSHLAMELLMNRAGLKMQHVPYRGSAAALMDLVAGHLSVNFQSLPVLLPQAGNPAISILASTGPQRHKDFPNVPTMIESGYPNFEVTTWVGVLAPAGLPDDLRDRLSGALRAVVQTPETQAKLRAVGFEPVGDSAAEFAAFQERELARWKGIARDTGIKLTPGQ